MVFDAENTARFSANYKEVARDSPRGLICPITLKDTPFRELCVGHILNQGLQHASRLTVPQRRDLDNFFGAIEADLVRYLNFPILSSAEHLAKVKRFTIRLPTGDRMEAFFAGDEAAKRFKRVDITNAQGELVASPYVRSNESMVGEYKDVEVEWEITLNDLALFGALIKSAYT